MLYFKLTTYYCFIEEDDNHFVTMEPQIEHKPDIQEEPQNIHEPDQQEQSQNPHKEAQIESMQTFCYLNYLILLFFIEVPNRKLKRRTSKNNLKKTTLEYLEEKNCLKNRLRMRELGIKEQKQKLEKQ